MVVVWIEGIDQSVVVLLPMVLWQFFSGFDPMVVSGIKIPVAKRHRMVIWMYCVGRMVMVAHGIIGQQRMLHDTVI
jgi:hypothetical protein